MEKILIENPNRFVIFPIQNTMTYGNITKCTKRRFGLQKK